jgi:hypothetical protein
MLTVFNVIVILLVLLIGYWWANQGLFSAILHLLCVIAAGAIAFGLWEPLTIGVLLRGSAFDNYAWGVSLIGIFALVLLALRVTLDKLVRANVDVPHWANLGFGFPVGVAAGVLTMGVVMIGSGYVQSARDIMGYVGYGRSMQNGRVESLDKLWLPVHTWTSSFYSLLSVTSLSTGQPLAHYNPRVDLQSASLLRDSALDGRGKFSLRPRDARIDDATFCATDSRYAVTVNFEAGSRDFGEMLTLSSAQIRLIADARGTAEARYAFPDSWTQYDGWHKFDSVTHFVTSEPGQQEAKVVLEFNARDLNGATPRFIQIRGTRYKLPMIQQNCDFIAQRGDTRAVAPRSSVTLDNSAPSIQAALEVTNSIRPITASTNNKPSGIEVTKVGEKNYISGGDGDFLRSGGERPARNLTIQGIMEPSGTKIVQVDISRESTANIFESVMQRAGEHGQLLLVDEKGRTYLPIGFIHAKPDNKTRIKVDFQDSIPTIKHLPILPTAGGETLKLLFAVTEGATVTGFKVSEVTVGNCIVPIPVTSGDGPQPKQDETPKAGGGGSVGF